MADSLSAESVLQVQCEVRKALQVVLPGDEVVSSDGWQGLVLRSHEDRTVTAKPVVPGSGDEKRLLKRDVVLVKPTQVGFPHTVRRTGEMEALRWTGSGKMNHVGQCLVNGARSAHDDREGVHFKKRLMTSRPIAEGLRIVRVSLAAEGMDQGWGNSGDSGVHISARSPGDALGDERVIVGVTYDRGVQQSRKHRADVRCVGAAAPMPGDCLELWLKCPQYGGWSADCSSATVTMTFERDEVLDGLGCPAPSALAALGGVNAASSAVAAYNLLWARLQNDDLLKVDTSHLGISGLRRQKCLEDPKEQVLLGEGSAEAVRPRIAAMLRRLAAKTRVPGAMAKLLKAEDLARRLEDNEPTGGAPQDPSVRRERYSQVLQSMRRTLDGLAASGGDEWPPPLCETVLAAYAAAEPECLYRWEREVQMCYDLVCGERTSVEAQHFEDIILRRLHSRRRRIAEAVLHRAKGSARNGDMHFDSYFYANINFGVLEQRDALLDPNRLNYERMGTGLDFSEIQAELMREYTPAKIRAIVREEIVDSRAEGSEAIRAKFLDWLRASVPDGFRSANLEAEAAARQEAWLFERCHDEAYALTDAALNFMLCRMGVLDPSRVADLFSAPEDLSPGARVQLHGLASRPELNGRSGKIVGPGGSDGSRWEVRLDGPEERGPATLAVKRCNFDVLEDAGASAPRARGRGSGGPCARRSSSGEAAGGACALQ